MGKQDLSVLAKEDVINAFSKDWALVTAGNTGSFNTMTVSWGGIGYLWDRPVVYLFIRPERYTHDFIERENFLTVSFYDEKYRRALQICGTKSGRDMDKAAEAGLTPVATEKGSVTFSQARLTIECRKLFDIDMTEDSFKDRAVYEEWYKGPKGGGLHTIYVAEIENVYSV